MKLSITSFSKVYIVALIVSLAGLGSIYNYQKIVTYGLIPFGFVFGLFVNGFKSYSLSNRYIMTFMLIVFWSFLLLIFLPVNHLSSLANISKLLGVTISMLVTLEFLSYSNYDFLKVYLSSFIIAFFTLSILLLYDIGSMNFGIGSGDYIDRTQFDLNANTYSYFSFFALFSSFYLIELYGSKYIWISIIISFVTIYLSFLTASRSGLLFSLISPGIYWLFIFNKLKINTIVKFIISLISLYYVFEYVYSIYLNSYLRARVETSLDQGDGRTQLVMDAINVFKDHIFTGVGPGQFYRYSFNKSSFSHNSYTEIAATLGLFGILLLLFLYFNPLKESIQLYFKYAKFKYASLLKLNITFFLLFIIYNNFYVFYLTTFGMIFFMMVTYIQLKGPNLIRIVK